MRSGEQPEQRAQPDDDDSDGAVTAAKAAFKITASKQLKGLMAHGRDPGDASTELLDELTQHRAGKSTSTAISSPHMQHVVASTGCSYALAMRTLLLKEEIAHLRRQGLSTAKVIENLNLRLCNAARIRKSEHENAGQPASLRLQQAKKVKLDEGVSTHPRTAEASRLMQSEWASPQHEWVQQTRPADEDSPPPYGFLLDARGSGGSRSGCEKRTREDTAISHIKKIKLRASLGDT